MLNSFFSLSLYLTQHTVNVQLFLQPQLVPHTVQVNAQLFLQPQFLPYTVQVDAQTFLQPQIVPHTAHSRFSFSFYLTEHSQAQLFLQSQLWATVFSALTCNVHRLWQVGKQVTHGRNQQVYKSRTPRTYNIGRMQYAAVGFVRFSITLLLSDSALSNGKTIQEWWPGKDVAGSGRNLIKLTYRYLPGKTDRTT